jgi:hexosaminidase
MNSHNQHRRRSRNPRRFGALAIGILAVTAAALGIGFGIGFGHGTAPGRGAGTQTSHTAQAVRTALSVPPPDAAAKADYAGLLPVPVSATATGGQFTLGQAAAIEASDQPAAMAVAQYLAGLLRPATGYPLPVAGGEATGGGSGIRLVLNGDQAATAADHQLGAEGYRLDVSPDGVTVTANEPAGLFHGVQTLRQLLPAHIEAADRQNMAWTVPAGHVVDYPRYGYRAAGLDVARHFFTVEQVERYIDQIALYKVDYLHLHLTDDQGWRLAIDGWPNLTGLGASTEVGGGPGGSYTKDDYRRLTAYAQARFVTIIPEIDVPGHVTAALAAYPALSCDGRPRAVSTGTQTGFSSLCASKPQTYALLDSVFSQLAALTPGPYIGIGGDEADSTSAADYRKIVDKAAGYVRAAGKIPWGWQETASAAIPAPSVAVYWNPQLPGGAVKQAAGSGARLVLDPANHSYLDQKYDPSTTLGLHWAGYIEVQKAYGWDPASYLPGVDAQAVMGVEADLWTETIRTTADIEFMAFPRLTAIAELGWSPESTHDWPAFRQRLAAQGPRWNVMGIHFEHSPQVPWPPGS